MATAERKEMKAGTKEHQQVHSINDTIFKRDTRNTNKISIT